MNNVVYLVNNEYNYDPDREWEPAGIFTDKESVLGYLKTFYPSNKSYDSTFEEFKVRFLEEKGVENKWFYYSSSHSHTVSAIELNKGKAEQFQNPRELRDGDQYHGCTILHSVKHGDSFIVVGANGNPLNHVSIMDITKGILDIRNFNAVADACGYAREKFGVGEDKINATHIHEQMRNLLAKERSQA